METESVEPPPETETTEEPQKGFGFPARMNMDVNMGINLSILLILTIFCGLLFLPAKMLLDTSYEVASETEAGTGTSNGTSLFLFDRKLKDRRLCPGLDYRYWLSSIFFSNYDRNCTYVRSHDFETRDRKIASKNSERSAYKSHNKRYDAPGDETRNETLNKTKEPRPKSLPMAGLILAMMLVFSATAAFVEVLRIRFINPKDTSATAESTGSRKGSTVELMSHLRFPPRTIKSQRSFDIQGMHRYAKGLFGAHPPPLLRRSSFPSYHASLTELPTINDATISRPMSRRTSINPEAILDTGTLHRRSHLIRRH